MEIFRLGLSIQATCNPTSILIFSTQALEVWKFSVEKSHRENRMRHIADAEAVSSWEAALLRNFLSSGLSFSVLWDTICFCFSRFCFLRMNARRFGFLSSRFTPLNTRGVCGRAIKKWPRECRETEVRKGQQHLPPSLEGLFGGTLAPKSKLPCCEEPKPHGKVRATLGWTVPLLLITRLVILPPVDPSLQAGLSVTSLQQQSLSVKTKARCTRHMPSGPAHTPDSQNLLKWNAITSSSEWFVMQLRLTGTLAQP